MMIELSMKRDGRTFDHQTLEAIRLMAIEWVREDIQNDSELVRSFFGAPSVAYISDC